MGAAIAGIAVGLVTAFSLPPLSTSSHRWTQSSLVAPIPVRTGFTEVNDTVVPFTVAFTGASASPVTESKAVTVGEIRARNRRLEALVDVLRNRQLSDHRDAAKN